MSACGWLMSDNSFMGRWYPEPFEFMPCRTAQHTPKWGRHVGCRERVKPCTLHTRISGDVRRRTLTAVRLAWGPGTCVSALRVQRHVYAVVHTCIWLAHTSHVVYADNAPPPLLPNYLRVAATVRLTPGGVTPET